MRMTRSRSSGRSKPHETPPGPGRKSNAPAGSTPRPGRLSSIAVTLGGEKKPPPPMHVPRRESLRPRTGHGRGPAPLRGQSSP
eukprot:3054936-Alexandrium_andersonii.AAC.1